MAGKIERMKELIDKIEKYDFECKAGFIEECEEWIELKKEIGEWEAMENKPCVDARPKNHIERMEEEAEELKIKIDKLIAFLEKEMEEKKYTDEYQRQLLAIQSRDMIGYYNTLLVRIDNDKKKLEKTEDAPCSTSESYNQAVEDCTRK